MKNLFERAFASYLGFAIGDALGATTEFMLPREIKSQYGVHKNIIGGGWLHLKPGRVTDDTEMCIALADSIIESCGYSVDKTADKFVKWMRSKPVDIGNTVRRGIKMYINKGQIISKESEFSAGNGAAMRNLPVVLYCLKNWSKFEEITLSQARFTHNNKLSDMATLVFGEMTRALIETGDKLAALDIVNEFIKDEPSFSHSRYNGEATGYIKDTFRTVNHFFFDGVSFEDVLIGTVNQGGDADTNGALAGMLAGAYYGYDAIPRRWIKAIDKKIFRTIESQTEKLLFQPVNVFSTDEIDFG